MKKIVSRYYRSLDLLVLACKYTNRAYVFDNSPHLPIWLCEVTNGTDVEIKSEQIPSWFSNNFLNKQLLK